MNTPMKSFLVLVAALAIGAGVYFFIAKEQTPVPAAPPSPAATKQVAPAPVPAPAPPKSDCLLPGPPPVPPDGRTATAADMALGHATIQNFVNELENYQACRNYQLDHAPPVTTTHKSKPGSTRATQPSNRTQRDRQCLRRSTQDF